MAPIRPCAPVTISAALMPVATAVAVPDVFDSVPAVVVALSFLRLLKTLVFTRRACAWPTDDSRATNHDNSRSIPRSELAATCRRDLGQWYSRTGGTTCHIADIDNIIVRIALTTNQLARVEAAIAADNAPVATIIIVVIPARALVMLVGILRAGE